MSEKPGSNFRFISFADETPADGRGLLIPRKSDASSASQAEVVRTKSTSSSRGVLKATGVGLAVAALLLVGVAGYGAVSKSAQVATPIITIVDPYTQTTSNLGFGSQPALSKHSFFIETRDAFVDEELTFIEIDLTNRQLRYFEEGVLVQSAEILSVGEEGSWWQAPSGLYQIEGKKLKQFSTAAQAYLPNTLTFESNLLIHGWPTFPGGNSVPADFIGGGIRLANGEALQLYEQVSIDTPVLVHAEQQTGDGFIYEPQVPELTAPHYLIADINNGTILAASELGDSVPIASITKLMTAVVAAEEIDLDSRVRVTSPNFVTSLIPRLSNRGSVSMYSLMQLLLVESSNEASEVIASQLGREEFVDLMNQKARQLGMMDSQFADPSGLSAENVSSLGDLYLLTKYINENRRFIFDITADNVASNLYTGGEFDNLVNFNEIEDIESFVGGKVGETNAAGQTSVSLHEIELTGSTRTLVVIVLGSQERTEDIKTLLEYVENRFSRE